MNALIYGLLIIGLCLISLVQGLTIRLLYRHLANHEYRLSACERKTKHLPDPG